MGATVAPVILSSDKTNLTRFAGDKSAWPVYLSVGNISKEVRRKPSARAMVLVGYVPVTKLECFTEAKRSVEIYRLFHTCMRTLLEPLLQAGQNGVEMPCADGFLRKVFPILAAYIADYPEQCLVGCIKENSCPMCDVLPGDRGDHTKKGKLRDQEDVLNLLDSVGGGRRLREFRAKNLRAVDPFWRDFPHCNIYEAFTPDLLHQLHKGVFKDHIVKWATEALPGEVDEVDARFKSMTTHQDLRHFKKGISLTSQWTGREHKNMQKVFLGVLAEATEPEVILAVRGVLDFIYYAHFAVHTEESLKKLDRAWLMFHENKHVFVEMGIREHFNISKLHNIRHYVDMIRSLGTADGYDTEGTERLHIDFAKVGYVASNKKEYIRQMTVWLTRQERIDRFSSYIQWSITGYEAPSPSDAADDEEEVGDDEADVSMSSPQTQVIFRVAKKPPIPALSIEDATSRFGAQDLLLQLHNFLQRNRSTSVPTPQTRLAVYKRAGLLLPPISQVSSQSVQDAIFAAKGQPRLVTDRGIRQEIPDKFSTALIRTRPAIPGAGPLDGIDLGEVRLIFRLPEESSQYEPPLLYVRWFKQLQKPVEGLGMFKTSFASHNRRPRASVVRLDAVLRSCHLIPAFGKTSVHELGWTGGPSASYYLNPYLRHYDFFFLRHELGCFLDQKLLQERQAEERRRAARRARGKGPKVG